MTPRRSAEAGLLAAAAVLWAAGCAGTGAPRPPALHPSTTLVGEPMPALSSLTPLNAAEAPSLLGRVSIVELGTTSCPGCRKLSPQLDALLAGFRPGSVQLVRVVDGRAEADGVLREHVERQRVAAPMLVDRDASYFTLLGVRTVPTVFVVDPEGKVVWCQPTSRIDLIEEWATDAVARSGRDR